MPVVLIAVCLTTLLGLPIHVMAQSTGEVEKVLASDGATGDRFGVSVSRTEQHLLVGAPEDDDNGQQSGSALIFRSTGSGWIQEAKLLPSDGQTGAWFGLAVAIHGRTAVVGAPLVSRAYVFELRGGAWIEIDTLIPSVLGGAFGSSVAIHGDTIAIGAPASGLTDKGAVFVFTRDGNGWNEASRLSLGNAAAGEALGTSVSVFDETILAGAPWADGASDGSGAAYIFGARSDQWGLDDVLMATDGLSGDSFGSAVCLLEGKAIVGAPGSDDFGQESGSAYIFERDDGIGWIQQQELHGSDSRPLDRFGSSVAMGSYLAVVGAPNHLSVGAGYAFGSVCGSLQQIEKFSASDGGVGDQLGTSVALSGLSSLLGAVSNDELGQDAGAAYAFDLQGPGSSACLGSGCPCGNEEAGSGCTNSSGRGGKLQGLGSARQGCDDLVLVASHLPPDVSAMLFMGSSLGWSPLFDGLRCSVGVVFRFTLSMRRSDAAGRALFGPGIYAQAASLAIPGSTWHFQVFYRDPQGPCLTGANLTNSYSVLVLP